jgi:long-chain acyl-CoA synthetase
LKGTLLGYLKEWAEKKPNNVALRVKKYGMWKPINWKSLHDQVNAFALGLINLGVKPGDTLAGIGDNAVELVVAELSIMRLGGCFLGIYPDMLINEVSYLLTKARCRIILVQDQEQTDKVAEIWDQVKEGVSKVIVWDTHGMSHYFKRYPFLVDYKDVISSKDNQKEKERLESIHIKPDDTALLLATSGTTGSPKLAVITHYNLIQAAEIWNQVHPYYEWDELFALLPLPWMGEQYTLTRFLHTGCTYNFPENQNSVKSDYRECQATIISMSPRMYEDICSDIRAKMEDASSLKKYMYNHSISLGLEHAERYLHGKEELPFIKKMLYRFALATTLRSLRQRVGLARVRLAATGGAAMGREVFTFYMALGINLHQQYSMTENCATTTCHYPNDIRPETVGKPLPGVDVKLDDDGMIYMNSSSNTKGYFDDPHETAKTIKDGWIKTGDAGYFDQYGHLIVIDRQKDLMFLNDGTRFSPQELENRIKFSPYVEQAMVFGDNRDMVTAMVSIDAENVGNWANKRDIPYTTFLDLSQNNRVIDLIREELQRINERLPKEMRIGRFVLLPKALHPDDGELTRTRKVKRVFINERYGKMIEALYGKETSHKLDIEIKYMDGKISRLNCNVRLETI